MEPLPRFQRSLKVRGAGELVLDEKCPLPVPEEDEVLVRVRCVAVNPVDAKVIDMGPILNATPGCEFAGDVVSVSPRIKNRRLKAGVAVFGVVCGNLPQRPDNGAFAEYVAIPGDLVYLLPAHLSYQQGASLSAALATVGMAVYQRWPVPLPYATEDQKANTTVFDAGQATTSHQAPRSSEPQPSVTSAPVGPLSVTSPPAGTQPKRYVLVYGGSTTCGAMALQLLRKSGLVPVSTCSPRNFAMVKGLGAEEVFDYHAADCGQAIRQYTGDELNYALDCITDVSSMRICYAAIGSCGGRYQGLNPLPVRAHTRRDIRADYTLVYTMFGKDVDWARPYGRAACPRDRIFAEGWFRDTQASLVDVPGAISPHPLDVGYDGLLGVVDGLDRMRNGDVSGVKLVYRL